MLMSDWNPVLYSKFEAERMRAARDLLARVPLASAGLIYDLGCGPGNSAELLLRRFPDAKIVGLDTSDSMLAHARVRAPEAQFVKQDIADWAPEDRPDLSSPTPPCSSCPITTSFFRGLCRIWRRAKRWPRKCRTRRAKPRTR